jgi:hypothetical protein
MSLKIDSLELVQKGVSTVTMPRKALPKSDVRQIAIRAFVRITFRNGWFFGFF